MKLPHWAQIAIGLASIVIAWVMTQVQSGNLVLPAVVLTVLPVVQTVLGILTPSASKSVNANAALKAAAVRVAGTILMLAIIVAAMAGCISSAPVVPVTASNSAQVNSCQSTAAMHNDFVIGDFAVGGIDTALSSVAAVASDSNVKTNLAIGAAVGAGVLVFGSAVVALTASNFTNSQCSNVVGSLPAFAPKPAAVSP